MPEKKIAIIAFDDFTDLDLILHWDILNRVRYIGGFENWSVRILGTKPVHHSFLGLPIPTSGHVDEVGDADGIIICSGKGTRPLIDDQKYLSRLKIDPSRQFVGAQCSGSLILGTLGFLKGIRVSAYPPIISNLQSYGAELVQNSLVVDGQIATASSCLAGQFLSEWLMTCLVGKEIAAKVMETVLPLKTTEGGVYEINAR